jgi:hypothetical protein
LFFDKVKEGVEKLGDILRLGIKKGVDKLLDSILRIGHLIHA